MKKLLRVAVSVCVVAAAVACATKMAGIQVGENAKDFTLKTADGKAFNLASYQGKKVVLLGIGDPFA